MAELKDRLRADLTAAMKARDELRTATLRMALSAVSTEEVSGKSARELSDAELTAVLTREAKRRREAADAYDDAARPELAQRERAELTVLADYLPSQLSEEELRGLVDVAVSESGADSPRGMGAVMRILTPLVAGRADGSVVAALVKERLSPR